MFMYLFGCAGSSSLHVGSSVLVAALRMFLVVPYKLVVTCGTEFLDQASNQGLRRCERRVLATGPPRKTQGQTLFFWPVNNLVFYLPKASCCRHWGPKTSRRDGGGGEPSCLPGAACPTLLPAGDGRVDRGDPCTIKYILNFVCVSRSVVSVSMMSWTVAHQVPLSKGFSRQEYWRARLLDTKVTKTLPAPQKAPE